MDSVFQFTRRFNEKINDRLHRQNKENAGKDFLGAKKTMFYGAIGLILLAVILFFSLTASLFRVPDLASPLGDFFTDSYGVLSFVVPIYLLCAAFILFDSGYKPERIFILNTTILPFFTLSIGFSFIRDFAYYESKFSFLSILGKNGFSFLMVFLTVMESLLIASLTKSLFPNSVKVRERQQFQSGIKQNVQSTQNFSQHVCEPQPFDILKHNSGTNNFEQSQDAAMFTKPSLNTLHYEPIDFDKEIRIVPYTPENLPVQNILSQAGLMEVEQVYNEAFKELQDLETST
ncbi:MAG: hypothetical protein LBV52_02050, partial [Spirochaetaceae bacterium]|nr:hypothetical protein [Spirochaetaceae bacterium]